MADGYGVGTVSDFAKSLMQNCGFIMAGFALFWHLVRTGSMSIDEALGVSIGFAALDKIWWCINWAGPLKQGITGPLVQVQRVGIGLSLSVQSTSKTLCIV